MLADQPTGFLRAGHGGYHNLHHINVADGTARADTGATLIASERKRYGYVTVSVDHKKISGSMTAVGKEDGNVEADADTFEYSSEALFLPDGEVVSL